MSAQFPTVDAFILKQQGRLCLNYRRYKTLALGDKLLKEVVFAFFHFFLNSVV